LSESPEAPELPELPLLQHPRAATRLITDESALQEAVAVLKATTGPIAIDAERASGFKYSQRAYLLMLNAPQDSNILSGPI